MKTNKCNSCTAEPRECVVDRRNTNTINMDTCDWNRMNNDYKGPDHKPPYYEVDAEGKPVHPFLTHYLPKLHGRNIEGFHFSLNNPYVLLLIALVVFVGVYFYRNNNY